MDEDIISQIIIDGDNKALALVLDEDPNVATAPFVEPRMVEEISHWIYASDTVLHFAAAAHRADMASSLLGAGALINVINRRGASPLHYAADGYPESDQWDAAAQVQTLTILLQGGADVDLADSNGATALHRAVRTRCADAVRSLVSYGADVEARNKSGSTAFHLAVQNTGRGGTGSDRSKRLQFEIIAAFKENGVSVELKDGKGRTVLDCCQSGEVRDLLS
ncbi:MAG: ankyrin repeat domain-containing protein [Pseudomonadota bacterium]